MVICSRQLLNRKVLHHIHVVQEGKIGLGDVLISVEFAKHIPILMFSASKQPETCRLM